MLLVLSDQVAQRMESCTPDVNSVGGASGLRRSNILRIFSGPPVTNWVASGPWAKLTVRTMCLCWN